MLILIKIFASSVSNLFYHYDDRRFDAGQVISGNDYSSKIDKAIVDVYEESCSLNITSILYMLNYQDQDYAETYEYGYQVAPIGKILKCFMDYSVIMCSEELKRCCMSYYNKHQDENIEDIKQTYIQLMCESYLGHIDSQNILAKYFDYSVSNKIEYICNSAKIVDLI